LTTVNDQNKRGNEHSDNDIEVGCSGDIVRRGGENVYSSHHPTDILLPKPTHRAVLVKQKLDRRGISGTK
jgi:hypothetical protein